jgi:uncharacterized protein (DUF1330 family)
VQQTVKLVLTLVAGVAIGAWGIPLLNAQPAAHPAYVIAETHIADPAGFIELQRREAAILAPYHGRILARALPDIREGAPADGLVTILAFASLQDANHWYNSPDYASLSPLRQRAATSRLYFLDGVVQ